MFRLLRATPQSWSWLLVPLPGWWQAHRAKIAVVAAVCAVAAAATFPLEGMSRLAAASGTAGIVAAAWLHVRVGRALGPATATAAIATASALLSAAAYLLAGECPGRSPMIVPGPCTTAEIGQAALLGATTVVAGVLMAVPVVIAGRWMLRISTVMDARRSGRPVPQNEPADMPHRLGWLRARLLRRRNAATTRTNGRDSARQPAGQSAGESAGDTDAVARARSARRARTRQQRKSRRNNRR